MIEKLAEHRAVLQDVRDRFRDVPEEELLREAEKAAAEVKADMKREQLERERQDEAQTRAREPHVATLR